MASTARVRWLQLQWFSSSCFRIVCIISTLLTGVQQSTRYCRALSCRHLCMMTLSLYVTRSATSSQCKSSCKILVRPWSNFLGSLTTRAAAFITRCSVSVTDFVAPASLALHWSTREVTNVWTSVAAYAEYVHTHIHPFNGPMSGTTRVSRYQKGKTSGFYWSKRQWVAVASAGPYASLHLAPDR